MFPPKNKTFSTSREEEKEERKAEHRGGKRKQKREEQRTKNWATAKEVQSHKESKRKMRNSLLTKLENRL